MQRAAGGRAAVGGALFRTGWGPLPGAPGTYSVAVWASRQVLKPKRHARSMREACAEHGFSEAVVLENPRLDKGSIGIFSYELEML